MKAKTLPQYSVLLILIFCLPLFHSQTFYTHSDIFDVAEGSSLQTSNQCDKDCRNGFNETMCEKYGICELQCLSSSRTSFPSVKNLIGDKCPGNVKEPASPPPAANVSNGNVYYNSTTDTCFINETVDLHKQALSMWIKGSCDNCSVLSIQDEVEVHLSNQGKLLVNGIEYETETNWVHLLFQKSPNNSLSMFINGERKTVLETTPDSGKIRIGVPSITTGDVILLDIQIYEDLLTDREVKYLHSENWTDNFDISQCRCPSSHPILDDSGYLCKDDSPSEIHRLTKIFTNLSAVNDGNTSTAWVSGKATTTTLTINLGNSFQISSIQLSFVTSEPSRAYWTFSLDNNVISHSSQIECSNTGCEKKSSENSYENYLKSVADTIKVTLLSTDNLIISHLTVNASCACNGNSNNCTRQSTANDYTCHCDKENNREGEHCENCVNGFFRNSNEFACNHSCQGCNDSGSVADRMCLQVGGKCNCRSNVEGTYCDTCKHLTYNLNSSSKDGCTMSSCNPDGSESCNNVTGVCNCYPNVTGTNCDSCIERHYNISSGSGCSPCLCTSKGTVNQNLHCDNMTGRCKCKTNVIGRQCDTCNDNYWKLESTNDVGCTECKCNEIGSANPVCDKISGQCPCWNNDTHSLKCIPSVSNVVPKYGPQLGGTLVTVTGHLLGGSPILPKIYLDEMLTKIVNQSGTKVVFRTANTTQRKDVKIKLTWNSTDEELNLGNFSYKPNPTVTGAERSQVTTFASGGCGVTVTGSNLKSVYQPKVKVNDGSSVNEESCEVQNSGVMVCPVPKLKPESSFQLDLQLDGLKTQNITHVSVVQDPEVEDDRNIDFRYPFEKKITITGKRLKTACRVADFKVKIGDEICKIIDVDDTTITCEPPKDAPGNKKELTINVSIGFFSKSIGKIYYKDWTETKYFVFIMLGIAAFILLLIIIVIACCLFRRHRKKKPIDQNGESQKFTDVSIEGAELQPINNQRSGDDFMFAIENPSYTTPDKSFVVISETFLHQLEESIRRNVSENLINEDQFQLGNICSHKGSISRVVNGNFKPDALKNPNINLTIKMPVKSVIDQSKLPSWTSSVLREALRLRKHINSNVQTVYGIGLDNKYFYLLYPYMENRTLKDHVVKPSNNFVLLQLVHCCIDISEGMDFLDSKDIVHKDLAARNCWVDSNQSVKVGDGAFSWDLYPDEYMFDKIKDRHIPVRWMAPESLQTGFYDNKSDVWSFGVVMWEVLTRGLLPFQEIPNEQVKNYIVKGYRLGKPELICNDLFSIMNMCWSVDAEDRPSFSNLTEKFQKMCDAQKNTPAQEEDMYINTSPRPESIYINTESLPVPVNLPPKTYKNKQEHIYGNV